MPTTTRRRFKSQKITTGKSWMPMSTSFFEECLDLTGAEMHTFMAALMVAKNEALTCEPGAEGQFHYDDVVKVLSSRHDPRTVRKAMQKVWESGRVEIDGAAPNERHVFAGSTWRITSWDEWYEAIEGDQAGPSGFVEDDGVGPFDEPETDGSEIPQTSSDPVGNDGVDTDPRILDHSPTDLRSVENRSDQLHDSDLPPYKEVKEINTSSHPQVTQDPGAAERIWAAVGVTKLSHRKVTLVAKAMAAGWSEPALLGKAELALAATNPESYLAACLARCKSDPPGQTPAQPAAGPVRHISEPPGYPEFIGTGKGVQVGKPSEGAADALAAMRARLRGDGQ